MRPMERQLCKDDLDRRIYCKIFAGVQVTEEQWDMLISLIELSTIHLQAMVAVLKDDFSGDETDDMDDI